MLFISLLITFLVGFFILTTIASNFSYLERLGGASLVGLGVQVMLMIFLDFVGISVSLTNIYIGSSIAVIGSVACLAIQKTPIQKILLPSNLSSYKKGISINVVWCFLASLAIYLWWMVTQKCLFYPPFEFDTVAGYDLMAKVLAAEGTFDNSLFNSDGRSIFNTAHRLVYPPFVAGTFGYAYMTGAITSKIITSVIFTSFLVMMYGLLRQLELTHLNSIFIVILILLIPEFVAHSSLSQTNMPQGVYTSLGFISFFIWFRDKKNKQPYFILTLLFLAINSLIRLENVLFSFLIGLLLLAHTIQQLNKENVAQLIGYGVIVLFPILFWLLYTQVNNLLPHTPKTGLDFSFNYDKLLQWWGYLWGGDAIKNGVLFNKTFFGLTPYLYFAFLVISSLYLFFRYTIKQEKNKLKSVVLDHWIMVYMTLLTLIVYSIFFYFIDYNWDSFYNVMVYSYKRGLFAVMILFSFFLGNNVLVRGFFDRVNTFIYQGR
ncbi:hypothetical protein [Aureispira sp. CCB-QB1]|uniref:hypothetical protein n=1 Tax=Aureispira sp. CCB-QB1 TaxID=1313421 RepID=UPI0006970A78|nr:hypothetical protein [Aureispira sp. CCB-QB1]